VGHDDLDSKCLAIPNHFTKPTSIGLMLALYGKAISHHVQLRQATQNLYIAHRFVVVLYIFTCRTLSCSIYGFILAKDVT